MCVNFYEGIFHLFSLHLILRKHTCTHALYTFLSTFFFSFHSFNSLSIRIVYCTQHEILFLIYCHLLPTFLFSFSIFLWMNNYCLLVLFIYYIIDIQLSFLSILVRTWIYYWFQFGILKRESFNANFFSSFSLICFICIQHSRILQCDFFLWFLNLAVLKVLIVYVLEDFLWDRNLRIWNLKNYNLKFEKFKFEIWQI